MLQVYFLFLLSFLITFFSCFIKRIQYIIHKTCETCVHKLSVLLVKLLVNSELLIVKFWESQKLNADTQPHDGSGSISNCRVLGSTVIILDNKPKIL